MFFYFFFFFLMIRRPPRSTPLYSSAASDVYKRQDDYGLFNLIIGSGAIQQGAFSSINWAGDSYYLKIEMDITGGTNYTNMGTTQFLSVPYAMHSKTCLLYTSPSPRDRQKSRMPSSAWKKKKKKKKKQKKKKKKKRKKKKKKHKKTPNKNSCNQQNTAER